jgi:hypothetical protein
MSLKDLVRRLTGAFRPAPPEQPVAETLQTIAGTAEQPSRIVLGETLLSDPTCKSLLTDIRLALGYDWPTYTGEFMPLATRAAEFLQTLPSSRLSHHLQPGGALIHCLETCLNVLVQTSSFAEYMPHDFRPSGHEKYEFRKYGRILAATMALAHDIGKIRHDVTLKFFDRTTGEEIRVPREYDPNAAGGLYSQTVYEYVKDVLDRDPATVTFIWQWNLQRDFRIHDRDWLPASNALLHHVGIRMPPKVLDTYFGSDTPRFDDIRRLKQQADRKSTNEWFDAMSREPAAGPLGTSVREISCWNLMGWAAEHRYLEELELVGSNYFLPLSVINRIVTEYSGRRQFGWLHLVPGAPEGFAGDLREVGLTVDRGERVDSTYDCVSHNEQRGVFLCRRLSALISLEVTKHRIEDAAAEAAEEQQASDNDSLDDSEPDEPVFDDASPPDYEDVSQYGDEVPDAAQYLEQPRQQDASPPVDSRHLPDSLMQSIEPLAPPPAASTVDELRPLAEHLEQLSEDELLALGTLKDNRLSIGRTEIMPLVRACGIKNLKTLKNATRLHHAERWEIVGDSEIWGMTCSQDYTRALLNPQHAHPLLVSSPASTKQSEQTTAQSELDFAPPLNEQPDHRPADQDSKEIVPPQRPDLAGLLNYLTTSDRLDSDADFLIDADRIRLSVALVDDYVIDPNRRGMLQNALRAAGAFSRRTKKYLYLNTAHEDVAQWLSTRPTPT